MLSKPVNWSVKKGLPVSALDKLKVRMQRERELLELEKVM